MAFGFLAAFGAGAAFGAASGFAAALAVGLAATLAAGLATRLAALIIAIEMGVAFFMVHHAALAAGPGNGELAFLYLAPAVAIFFGGAGKFSVDGA